jgi:hypothetical protein
MNKILIPACLCAVLIVPSAGMAQDIAITNVRVIVGSGQVIDTGTIIVRGGKIVSVTAGAAPTQGLRTIDAKGMSAMPGFIDGHKHVNNFNAEQMKSLLEAGYTTVLSGGGPADQNIALRDRIDRASRRPARHPVGADQSPSDAGRRPGRRAGAGREGAHTGEIALTPEPGPPQAEIEVIKAIVDEAKKVGVQVNVHAVSSPAMVAAVDAGVTRLVHTPNKDFTTWDQAERVAQTGSIVAGMIGFGAPNIEPVGPPAVQWPKDNTAASATASRGPKIAGANRDLRRRPAPRARIRLSTRAASGTPTRTTGRSRTRPTRTPRISWCSSTS